MGYGKPWVRALRAFRMVSSILRQSFLQTDFKTWEEICEYLERARLYPTGRHCVDNLITPTLLAHQLLRSERDGGGLASTSALHQASIALQCYRWTPQQWKVPLVALLRDVSVPACRGQGRPSLRCICLQTHMAGSRNAVSVEQFGEHTAIQIGKGGLKGITLSSTQVPHICICF